MNTKQPSSGVQCGNIFLFGVAEDQLHPVGSDDPPKLSVIATQHTKLW